MKKKNIFLSIIFLILLAGILYAIPQGGVTPISPDDDVWTNEGNYTDGFNVSWNDPEHNYNASCELFIGTENNVAIILATVNGSYGTVGQVEENTNIELTMNHTFPTNNTQYYWTIKCINESFLPWIATTPRILKQDISIPSFNITNHTVENNTWSNSGSLRFEFYATDDQTLGENLTVRIFNSTDFYVFGSASVENGSQVNLTISLPDGNYTLNANVTDPAENSNTTSIAGGPISFSAVIDTTDPVITDLLPANGTVWNDTEIGINFTITELNLATVYLEWNGTNETFDLNNCTSAPPQHNCSFNKTVTSWRYLDFKTFAIDEASNDGISATNTMSIDLDGISFIVNNWTVSNSVANYVVDITDTTPTTCSIKLYQKNESYIDILTGTINTGIVNNCTGTIQGSDIGIEGNFRAEFNLTDEAGNQNITNVSGVYNALYEGWNLITYPNTNRTSSTIVTEILNATQVSWYNNSIASFVTYSTSTPGTNNATQINPGDAIFVYLNANTSFIENEYLPTAIDESIYAIIYTTGWNAFGLTENSNVSAVYNTTTNATSYQNITWTSWYNASSDTFNTCKKGGTCAGTSDAASDIDLPRGHAVWILSDLTANLTINRSIMGG